MYMVVCAQEWWIQEWHVWAGLAIGVASLVIGALAFAQALLAKSAAGKAETAAGKAENAAAGVGREVDSMINTLKKDLDLERTLRSIPPVVADPASFVLARLPDGNVILRNNGKGTGYNVRLTTATDQTYINGDDRWAAIEPGEEKEVAFSAAPLPGARPAIEITWREDALGEEHSRILTLLWDNQRGYA